MSSAKVGDDVYREDPTVIELEELASSMLGKSSAIFAPSGTQTNLIALLSHCARGDEYIVASEAHTYKYEGGGAAALGGIQSNCLIADVNGTINLSDLARAIRPKDIHFARTKLVCLENTYGGYPLPPDYPKIVKSICRKNKLALHLDGARIFNAVLETNSNPVSLTEPFDSVSICLSKGLGAPIGSILLGSRDFIETARRWRKVLGGGLRQAGILAAGGIYALKNNVTRLKEDHEKASEISSALSKTFAPELIRCQTNMVHLDLVPSDYSALANHLLSNGITVGRSRWVFHKDISFGGIKKIKRLIRSFKQSS